MFTNIPFGLKSKLYLGVLSATIVAFLLFAFLYRGYARQNALEDLRSETSAAARIQAKALESELQKFSLLPLVLSENLDVLNALEDKSSHRSKRHKLNDKLASLAAKTGAPYLYVIDNTGNTIASSNHDTEDRFVGRSYDFRPYYKLAMDNGVAEYYAKGDQTGKAGLFFARRVDADDKHLGVVVVKVEFGEISSLWKKADSKTFIVNDDLIILFSSDNSLNYLTLKPLSEKRRQEIYKTKQFGDERLNLAPLSFIDDLSGADSMGREVIFEVLTIPILDWHMYRIVPTSTALKTADLQIQLHLLSAAIFILGIGLFIAWRLAVERQRSLTTAYLKTEVARQTKELSDSNNKLELEMHEREQINQRFRKAREELAQANRLGSIGAITASVAHEVNQPVASIHSFAESATKLLNRQELGQAKENLESIVSLTSRIGAIITELRRYARRGNKSISQMSASRISVDDVVDGVELLMGDRIRASGNIFRIVRKDASSLYVKAGRVRLEQVIVNLLQNASEAIEDVPLGTIEMRISSNQEYVYITVSDNGSGIPKEIESDVFTPFFTQKPDGLGIGLGISKDIMNDFEGAIEITPSSLGGAAFKLTLQRS